MAIDRNHKRTNCKAIVKPFNEAFGTHGENGEIDGWICEKTNPPYPTLNPDVKHILAYTVRSAASLCNM
jgi:hypothetical protein